MRLRSPRGKLLLSNLTARAGTPRATGHVRPRRIRRWLRTGALLSVIGIRRFVRTARTRWRPVFLVAGALVLVIGLLLRSSVAVVLGMLVMGSAAPGIESHSPSAATVRTWMWLHKNQADNR
jgi:hypothetical protein